MGPSAGAPSDADIQVRRATSTDDQAVLALLGTSLGWVPDDQHAAFFEWKHRRNPAGASPAWVALDGERLVGYRTFVRWEFEQAGHPVAAVRAVDTATHPDYRGRGIFSRLTRHALESLRDEAVAFVFNTPNERSRPGYLKMGWQPVAKLGVVVRPCSLAAPWRWVRSRVPAEKWSLAPTVGVAAGEVVGDGGSEALLASQPPAPGLRTSRHRAFLEWRYGFAPLAYRALLLGDAPEEGFAIFRLRRRGAAVEGAICEVLVPGADPRKRAQLLRRVAAQAGADHLLELAQPRAWRAGFVPLPGQGPTLVYRGLTTEAVPPREQWHLELGDVELF